MDIDSLLKSHPLFADFSAESLDQAVAAARLVTYQSGEVCIDRQQGGELFGVLISGRLRAVRGYATAEEQHVGYVEPGECFGEMSMLTGDPSNTDVVSLIESQAVVFEQQEIGPIIAVNPQAVRFMAKQISRRLAPPEHRAAKPAGGAVRFSLGASAPTRIVSLSCRRSDIRFRYFDTTSEEAQAGGLVCDIGRGDAHLTYWKAGTEIRRTVSPSTHEKAIEMIVQLLTDPNRGVLDSIDDLSAIGHRVCHGGLMLDGPEIVTDRTKDEIRRLIPMAPMENPYNLAGIEACQAIAPALPQVAVFDTAFLLTMPPAAYRYALPEDLATEPELRRFGSHGISHEGAARAACEYLAAAFDSLEIVSCHLGSGASITAIDHGRAIDSTMGMTSLEGLTMATRCGDLDPGVLLHLICERHLDPRELSERLYTESGLLGLSGISGDFLTVLQAADGGHPRALLAVQNYCRRARKQLGAQVSLLGGADAVVFTGGVAEHQPGVRARICQDLDCLGLKLDEARNHSAAVKPGKVAEISSELSPARILVVGSNEEHTIACHTVRALAAKRVTNVIRLHQKPIPINSSAHHVHLTQEHVEALFGPGKQLTRYADLSQPGQFACAEQVSLIGPKSRIDRVRVLGPVRDQTQVEISRTEEFKLGVDAPVRMSGDLKGTPGITLEGTCGQVVLEQGLICAMRHVHMPPQDAMEFALRDRDVVRIRVAGKRSLIFGDVVVRVSGNYVLDMHLDTDEANAAELGPGAVGYLDSIQERVTA